MGRAVRGLTARGRHIGLQLLVSIGRLRIHFLRSHQRHIEFSDSPLSPIPLIVASAY